MRKFLMLLVCACLLGVCSTSVGQACSPASVQQKQMLCRVATVKDGDTVQLAGGGIVRLAGIDAPERDPEQFGARRALQRVKELLAASGWQVYLEPVGKDRYGRCVADLRLSNGQSLCEILLREGLVLYYWHKELPDQLSHRLLAAQREALQQRAGNWAQIFALPVADESFVGNRKSRRFFSRGCRDGNKIAARNRQPLASLEAALELGYSPARQCGIWPSQRMVESRR